MRKADTGKIIRNRLLTGLGRILSLSALFLITCSLLPTALSAEVPLKITYQGNIRQNGNLVTGTRNIIFKIYPSSDSVSELWTSPTYPVAISTGVFKVDLAPAIADLTAANWENGSLWLELVIEGVPLSPRDELTSSPFSVNTLFHSGKRYSTAAAAPLAPALGDMWYDSTSNVLKYWNGAWIVSGAGVPMGDDLGNHTALQALNMSGNQIYNISSATITGADGLGAAKLRLNPGVELSSATAADYGGVYASSHVYVNGDIHAVKLYGDISGASGLPGGDNLGDHTATQNLEMQGFSLVNAAAGAFTQGVTASSFTATGTGLSAAQLKLAGNVLVSSEAAAGLGGGVRVSTNIYIVGFSSATKYYGDGSALTGLTGLADNLGNHTATQALNMAGQQILGVSTLTVAGSAFSVGGSTLTVSGGKVGIGVASPSKALEVKNTGTTFKVDTTAGYGSLYIDGVEMVRLKP